MVPEEYFHRELLRRESEDDDQEVSGGEIRGVERETAFC